MFPFPRFTEPAQQVLTIAQEEAERSHRSYIGTEHLLVGLLRQEVGTGGRVLHALGVDLAQVRTAIDGVMVRNERGFRGLIPTSRVRTVIERAFEEARQSGRDRVGTEHLLIGMLVEGQGIAAHVLQDAGAGLEKVRAALGGLGDDAGGSAG